LNLEFFGVASFHGELSPPDEHPGVSLGVLAHVLWVLQLDDQLGGMASLESDPVGRAMAVNRLPQRVTREVSDDLDF